MSEASDDFIVNVNSLSSSEEPLIAIEISHPALQDTVRLIRDNCDLISNGETYIAFQFDLDFFDDVENELTKGKLRVQNIGRDLVKWIESSYGAKDAQIKILILRRSEPDIIEFDPIPAYITRTNITTQIVEFDLIIAKNNFTQRGTRFVFNRKRTPGIF